MSVVLELFGDVGSLYNSSFITLDNVIGCNSFMADCRHGIGGVTS